MPQALGDSAAQNETPLTVALLGPNEQHRKAVALALSVYPNLQLHEFSSFPPNVERLHQKLAQQYDIVIIDADTEPDRALILAEGLGTSGHTYVMAYSVRVDMRLAVRFMRAGAREFLTLPLDPIEVAAALRRASAHREAPSQEERPAGKVFVFLGTKGGCGVTTVASNFALALAQESSRNTLLIDLGLPLGDVAINLGMVNEYSVATALQYPNRLDANMLSSIVVKHRSGLSVLAAPSELEEKQPAKEAIDEAVGGCAPELRLCGGRCGIATRPDALDSIRRVRRRSTSLPQVGISEMRNANRMISKFFTTRDESADCAEPLQIQRSAF